MTDQPTALRLADELDHGIGTIDRVRHEAAAELRRLHGLDFALRNCELALKKMATKYMDAVDQRDALLEALKGVLRVADRKTDEFDAARAAIAKAEGEKA